MAIRLNARGHNFGLADRVTAVATTSAVMPIEARKDYVLVAEKFGDFAEPEAHIGYAAIVTTDSLPDGWNGATAVMSQLSEVSHIRQGHVVYIDPVSKLVRVVYRPESPNNTIFATDRCNSNCLMCSQPPKDVDDSYLVQHNLRMISLIKGGPPSVGITGGEPTLLGDGLIRILTALRDEWSNTYVHMLTNGRNYAEPALVNAIADVRHPNFVSAVPLYADVPEVHDYVVQAKGAFWETLDGLYNAAEAGLRIEIRVVLHKQTLPRLGKLVEFIYRNLPFVEHVALMGLEHMGYVKKNWDTLWIDPIEYKSDLRSAVEYLHHRGMHVSVYNLPLCLVDRDIHSFAQKSISDFKNIYLPECEGCTVMEHCSGVFSSWENRHSANIRPYLETLSPT